MIMSSMYERNSCNIKITLGDKKNTEEKKVGYTELGAKGMLIWNKRRNKETGEMGGRNKSNTVNKSILAILTHGSYLTNIYILSLIRVFYLNATKTAKQHET